MEWISVNDRLPEIPEGKFSIGVDMAVLDHTYESINPGHGYDVVSGAYGKVTGRSGKRLEHFDGIDGEIHFMQLYIGMNFASFGPIVDDLTHWQYRPAPPEVGS